MTRSAWRLGAWGRLAILACAMGVAVVAAPQTADRAALRQAVLTAEDARAPTAEDVQLLRRAASGRDEDMAVAAVRALGRLERPALVGDLLAFLEVKSPRVRAEAANALGQAVSTATGQVVIRVRDVLLKRLQAEEDASVFGVVCQTLGRLRYPAPEAIRSVERSLLNATRRVHSRVRVRPSRRTAELKAPIVPATVVIETDDSHVPVPVLLGAVKGLEALLRVHRDFYEREIQTEEGPERRPVVPEEIVERLVQLARATDASGQRASEDEAARVRRFALQALEAAQVFDDRVLEYAATDPDDQARRLAVRLAGSGGVADHRLQIIQRALRDSAPMVRHEAIGSYFRRFGPSEPYGCGPVLERLADSDSHVVLMALDTLGLVLCSNEREGREDQVARVAAFAERWRLHPEDAADQTWHTAAHSLATLARIAPERAMSMLSRFAADPTWQVRMYAARAAATLEDATILERLASDPHANVREAAIGALITLKGHEADGIYLAALESPDYQLVRTAARGVKGSPARERAVRALLTALARITAEKRDTSRDPRMGILDALRGLGSAAGASALEPYLKDFDPRVAAEAASILTAWTGQKREPETTRFAPTPAPQWSDIAKLEGARARFVMKGGGAFEMALFPSEAPATVDRFVRLARRGYYDGLTFHRVVANFVIQGGSPDANEYMGDGPYLRDEVGLRPHRRGAVGISTRGRDTGDAQIFINLVDNPRLDHTYTVFAEVMRGMDAVDRVREGDTIATVEIVMPRRPN